MKIVINLKSSSYMCGVNSHLIFLKMQKTVLILALILLVLSCNKKDGQKVKVEKFHWTMYVPEEYQKIEGNEITPVTKTPSGVADSTGQVHTIFEYSDGSNHIKATDRWISREQAASARKDFSHLKPMLYETLRQGFPSAVIDTFSRVEKVGQVPFQTYSVRVSNHGIKVAEFLFYNHVFGANQLDVSLVIKDDEAGAKLLESWRGSTFK